MSNLMNALEGAAVNAAAGATTGAAAAPAAAPAAEAAAAAPAADPEAVAAAATAGDSILSEQVRSLYSHSPYESVTDQWLSRCELGSPNLRFAGHGQGDRPSH